MKTLQEKIAIMTAAANGAVIESATRYTNNWEVNHSPLWDWISYDYRVQSAPIEGDNPENLTAEQIGIPYWRLLTAEEKKTLAGLKQYPKALHGKIEMYLICDKTWVNGHGSHHSYTYRTQLTADQFAEIVGSPVKLGPDDFPPGTVVRNGGWTNSKWKTVLAVSDEEISISNSRHANGIHTIKYNEFTAEGWQRSIDSGKTWI